MKTVEVGGAESVWEWWPKSSRRNLSPFPQHAFDYQDGDVFGCVADVGWITGHSYVVYGPLANGATTVLFESTPTYPDPGNTILHHLITCPLMLETF